VSLEQMAILGIVMFAIIIVIHGFNTVRSIRRAARSPEGGRVRRAVSGEAAARAMAEGLVRDVAREHPDLVAARRETGETPPDLDRALEKSREYFLDRVERRHRALFNLSVDRILAEVDPPPPDGGEE